MLKNWGYLVLADKAYDESIEEMRHADILTQRILFLDGLPNLQKLGPLSVGEDVPEIIACDLALELTARTDLQAAIRCCEEHQDYVSRETCQSILSSEEEHIDWLQTQQQLIKQLGKESYLQMQVGQK